MNGVFIPQWVYRMNLTWPEKNVLGLIVSMRDGFFGSNGYIASVFSLTNENARYIVHSLSKQGVIYKMKRSDGKRLLVPSSETVKFSEDPDLLVIQTELVSNTNNGVSNTNKPKSILYIDKKEKESYSISKVDTRVHSETKTISSSTISKKEESKEKVGFVSITNNDPRLIKALRNHGCTVPYDDILRIMADNNITASINRFGRIPGISGMAKKIQAIYKNGYDINRDISRQKQANER